MRILQDLKNHNYTGLKAEVADYIVEHARDDEEAISLLKDICIYGCKSGFVGTLIYYSDTEAFYDKHIQEIEKLKREYEREFGMKFDFDEELYKNHMAWFGFEEAARQICYDFDIDI